jgi:PPP family 3-phenylpropionic acid transporter
MSSFPIKLQFFLTYGVLGSLGPLGAMILKDEKGFDANQIAWTLSISSIGMVFSPAILTFLADRDFDSRKILRFLFIMMALAFTAVYFFEDPTAITAAWACYSILFAPTLPLLDGYYFNYERRHGDAKSADGSYQFVRVWGTVGFMVPSIVLYFSIKATGDVSTALWCAVAWCAFAIVGTFKLSPCPVAKAGRTKAPTFDAIRTIFSGRTIPMCAGLILAYVAANAYYPYLSIFLKDEVGIAPEWVTPIMSIGVAIEIGYLYGLGPIRRLLRIRGIMIVGLGTMALRLSALAFFPTLATALLIQIFHGMEILAMFVVPVIYLDRIAGDSFRNSIQGAFAITLTVPARLVGYLSAGYIATRWGSGAVLYFASALSAVSMLVILLFFKPLPAKSPASQGST